jgi:hypothetical protein
MKPKLTDEQQQAVETNHGCIAVEGAIGPYVLMRLDVYCELLGIGTDAEYEASLEAIRQGWADAQAGRTQPVKDFFADFDRAHGIAG